MTLNDDCKNWDLSNPPNLYRSPSDFLFFTGKKGHQQLNKLLRRIVKEDKIKSKRFMDIDGREVKIGDTVITAAYIEGYGVVKLRIIGETRTKWRVERVDTFGNTFYNKDKIEKTNSLFIVG